MAPSKATGRDSARPDPSLAGMTARARIQAYRNGDSLVRDDLLAVEEPLEIRLSLPGPAGRTTRAFGVTMRTPGHDRELAAGLLYAEGVIGAGARLSFAAGEEPAPARGGVAGGRLVVAEASDALDASALGRALFANASCGVCGKAALEAIKLSRPPRLDPAAPRIPARAVKTTMARLAEGQTAFARTGGLHAAALFDEDGKRLCLYEDVGRHNAVDKVVGSQLLAGALPLERRYLAVSGRLGFEIVQKALAAGLPLVMGVGAPSSLAVELAGAFDQTLVGFARGDRFNVYTSPQRISGSGSAAESPKRRGSQAAR